MNIRRLHYKLIAKLLIVFFLIAACDSRKNSQGQELSLASRVKLKQYTVKGFVLYNTHCSNCHQKDGTGLKKLYPPLYNADYLKDDPEKAICIIKYGIEGPVVVNQQEYNLPMPANEKLTDLEIAEIMTYVYAAFIDEERLFEIGEVKAALEGCK